MLIQLLIICKQGRAGRHDVHRVQRRVHRAAGRVEIVVDRRRQRVELLRIADIAQIEIQVLRPVHVLGAYNVIVRADNVGAVELIPHHTVVKAGRFLHQARGEFLLRHRALHQEAVGLHLGGPLGAGVILGTGAGRRNAVVVRNDQICAALLGPLHQQLRGVGLDRVVGIDELQILAPGLPQAHVAGRGHAAVSLVDEHDARIDVGIHLADLQADVLAAVVQQQDFKVPVGLAADTLHTAGDMILGVINRHDNTDKRLLRHGGGPPFCSSISTIPHFCPVGNGKSARGVV